MRFLNAMAAVGIYLGILAVISWCRRRWGRPGQCWANLVLAASTAVLFAAAQIHIGFPIFMALLAVYWAKELSTAR